MNKKTAKSPCVIEWLDTGIFPFSICFSCGFTYKEIMKHFKKLKADDWASGLKEYEYLFNPKYNGFAIKNEVFKGKQEKTLFYLILPNQFEFTDRNYITLAHEIVHLCQFMLPDILKRDKEIEAEAYLHSHIMGQCLTVLRNKNSRT